MRISTTTIMRNYRNNLATSNSNLNTARTKALTSRKFLTASEDPASAAKAAKLRQEYLRTDDYIENANYAQQLFDTMEGSMNSVYKMADEAYINVLAALNGTKDDDDVEIYAQTLRNMQKSMINDMNSKYSNDYLFGGSSSKDMPFNLAADGTLTFRGVDVNSTNPADQAKLQAFEKEQIFVDLGFGMEYNSTTGKIEESSAFNIAMPGISFLGYGNAPAETDATGATYTPSKNVITLLGQLADEMEKGAGRDDDKIRVLSSQLESTKTNMLNNITGLGTKGTFLEHTKDRLQDQQINLNEKILDTEYVDPAEAYTNYAWTQFAYNSALKIGTGILSQSFIDFMR